MALASRGERWQPGLQEVCGGVSGGWVRHRDSRDGSTVAWCRRQALRRNSHSAPALGQWGGASAGDGARAGGLGRSGAGDWISLGQ